MAEGRVTMGERPLGPADRVGLNASITVRPAPPEPSSVTPDPSIAIDVVYEDESVLVLDKPAGLVVHPAKGHWEGTLVHGLAAHAAIEAEPGEPWARPGIVHRLDRLTSGVLVVAKTPEAREKLKDQFAAHTIEREYVAIVQGVAHTATFTTMHGRHERDRMRFTSLGRVIAPKRAVTHVTVAEPLGELATVVACRLETGRTHQIRVHLAEQMKTPVLADPVYGKKPNNAAVARIAEALGRQALHARVLGFIHPTTGAAMRFESPVPPDIARALRALRTLSSPDA